MVRESHSIQRFFNGFGIPQPNHCGRWFLMVVHRHRPKDVIVTYHRSWAFYYWISFFTDISMRSDTAVFVKAFSFLRLLTGRGSSNGSAEIFHRRKRKSSFDEKTPLFRGFYAPRLPEREEGVWGRGRNCWHSTRGKPAPIFSSVSPLANIFPPPCAIMPAVKSAVFFGS